MAAIWSEPNSPFFQPLPGFTPGTRFAGGVPSYGNTKVGKPFKPDAKGTDIRSELPYPVVGIDFSSGQRDATVSLPTQSGDYTSSGSTVPSTLDQYLNFTKQVLPYQMQMQEQAAAFYVAQKVVPKANAFRRAFNQARNVGSHKALFWPHAHHA